jgi:hypothetical protein
MPGWSGGPEVTDRLPWSITAATGCPRPRPCRLCPLPMMTSPFRRDRAPLLKTFRFRRGHAPLLKPILRRDPGPSSNTKLHAQPCSVWTCPKLPVREWTMPRPKRALAREVSIKARSPSKGCCGWHSEGFLKEAILTTLQRPSVPVPVEGRNATPGGAAAIVHVNPEPDELHVRVGVDVRLGGRPIRILAAGLVPPLIYILIHVFLK